MVPGWFFIIPIFQIELLGVFAKKLSKVTHFEELIHLTLQVLVLCNSMAMITVEFTPIGLALFVGICPLSLGYLTLSPMSLSTAINYVVLMLKL